MRISGARGNVLFLILIAVALFAALSYAITQSSRGTGSIAKEQAMIDTGVSQQCTALVEAAVMKLNMVGGCPEQQISYELPNGTNENPQNPSNTSCFLFNANGAGLTACGVYASGDCPAETLQSLSVGQVACGTIVYAGMSGGKRIYTSLANHGTNVTYDQPNYVTTGASSASDGMANTNTLLSAAEGPYQAALICRGLGAKWYVPARSEAGLLYTNRSLIGGLPGIGYWTSTECATHAGNWLDTTTGSTGACGTKNNSYNLRCVRSD